MKEMIYEEWKAREKPPTILAQGNYKGYPFHIISYHSHPCAYITVNEYDKFYRRDSLETGEIECHGGITYSEDHLHNIVTPDEKLWVLGWDYSHAGDRWCDKIPGKEWTTMEILEEVYDVIEELIRLN